MKAKWWQVWVLTETNGVRRWDCISQGDKAGQTRLWRWVLEDPSRDWGHFETPAAMRYLACELVPEHEPVPSAWLWLPLQAVSA